MKKYEINVAVFKVLYRETIEAYMVASNHHRYEDASKEAEQRGIFVLEWILSLGICSYVEETEALLEMALYASPREAAAIELLLSMGANPLQLLRWLKA